MMINYHYAFSYGIQVLMIDRFIHKTLGLPYRLKKQIDEGSGQAVIFLHGVASSHHNWDAVIPHLKGVCRAVSFDLLGFGESPKPDWASYTVDDHVKSLRRSITALSLDEPCVLVGHSMGGIIAVAYAAKYPADVSSLILCGLPIYTTQEHKGRLGLSLDRVYERIYQRIIANKSLSLHEAAIIKKFMKYSQEFEANETTWHGTAHSLQNTILAQKTLEHASTLKLPIDLISGKADPLVIKNHLSAFSKQAPQSKMIYINAAHTLNANYVAAIVSSIKSHLS